MFLDIPNEGKDLISKFSKLMEIKFYHPKIEEGILHFKNSTILKIYLCYNLNKPILKPKNLVGMLKFVIKITISFINLAKFFEKLKFIWLNVSQLHIKLHHENFIKILIFHEKSQLLTINL